MSISGEAAQAVLARADQLYNQKEIGDALDRSAAEIAKVLHDKNPLVICVMTGGMVPTAEYLLRLNFPLQLDYVHATRYGDLTSGGKLVWLAKPRKSVKDRVVLIVDDILDEGQTLHAIVAQCKADGAQQVYTAVLVDKLHNRKQGMHKADFTCLTVPDRYVFGYGMDFKGFLRNVPGIYAAQKNDE